MSVLAWLVIAALASGWWGILLILRALVRLAGIWRDAGVE